jgi:hypothetical protein
VIRLVLVVVLAESPFSARSKIEDEFEDEDDCD